VSASMGWWTATTTPERSGRRSGRKPRSDLPPSPAGKAPQATDGMAGTARACRPGHRSMSNILPTGNKRVRDHARGQASVQLPRVASWRHPLPSREQAAPVCPADGRV
jgi:hypothetical protein